MVLDLYNRNITREKIILRFGKLFCDVSNYAEKIVVVEGVVVAVIASGIKVAEESFSQLAHNVVSTSI